MTTLAIPRARVAAVIGAGCAAMASTPLAAQSTQAGVSVGAEAAATSNPYLNDDETRVVGVVKFDLRPWLHAEGERTTFDLSAYFTGRAFSSVYDFEDSEGVTASFRSKRSERTTVYGSAILNSSSARSALSLSQGVPSVGDPTSPVDPGMLDTEVPAAIPTQDVTLLGLIGRSTGIGLAAGVDHQLDELTFAGANAAFDHLSADRQGLVGYDSLVGSVRLLRQISSRTRGGARLSARSTHYEAGGDASTWVAEAMLDHRLSEYWTATLAGGLSSTRTEGTVTYPANRTTGFSGRVEFCQDRPGRNLCVNGERSQSPGAFGVTQVLQAVGLRYGERISARDRLDVSARYAHSKSVAFDVFTLPTVEVASVQADYARTIGDRLESYAFGSVARSYNGVLSTTPSFAFGIGVRMRLGRGT